MSFIEDFIYKPEQQKVLETAIGGSIDILRSRVDEIDRNIVLSKLLTYKRIQFQRIDITNVAYSLNSLLNNSQVISLMGGSKNTTMAKRLEMWNSMTSLEQANILDMTGYYLEFTDNILSNLTDDLKNRRFDIVDFELCDLENNMLVRNVDYVFFDNKLMLLKEFLDSSSNYKKKYLIMKNIVIDIGLTESVLGGFMHMPSNKELTKVEYNEILKGFTEAASKGPNIGEYRSALNRYKSLEGVRVYDKTNADATRRHFWGSDNKIGDFTSFDFIVSMPVQLVYKPEKLQYIINFFNQTKPAYTNFIFSPELTITDVIPMKAKPTLFKMNSWMSGILDKLPSKIIPEYFNNHWFSESYLLHQEVTHKPVKTPIYTAHDKWLEIIEKETTTSYMPINNILDLIPNKTLLTGYLETSFIDKVQIGKGIGADSYRLDEDYFDLQVIADPIFSKILRDIADVITYKSSKISVQATPNLLDKHVYTEKFTNYGETDTIDKVKIINTKPLDDSYETDSDDYVDMQGISDPLLVIPKHNTHDILSANELKTKIDSITTVIDNIYHIESFKSFYSFDINERINLFNPSLLTEAISLKEEVHVIEQELIIPDSITGMIKNSGKVTVLNAKNLYDRMSNEDIASKTIIVTPSDNAYLSSKANIVECDSIFDCDYSEESCMVLDSVPDNYNENIKADFISRELISLELIPKNN